MRTTYQLRELLPLFLFPTAPRLKRIKPEEDPFYSSVALHTNRMKKKTHGLNGLFPLQSILSDYNLVAFSFPGAHFLAHFKTICIT